MIVARYIATVLLLLAFAGQGLAAVSLTCSQVDSAEAQQGMDHSEHADHHAADEATGSPVTQCCDGGYCSQSGCLALSAVPNAPSGIVHSVARTVFAQPAAVSDVLAPDSLYRPPSIG